MRTIDYTAEGLIVRKILSGMIGNPDVLQGIIPLWSKDAFPSSQANDVAEMCVKFQEAHGGCPGNAIITVLAEWAAGKQEDQIGLVDKLIQEAMGEPLLEDGAAVNHVVASARQLFEGTRLKRTMEETNILVERGELDKAREKIFSFAPLAQEDHPCIDVMHDRNALRDAMTRAAQPSLIEYPQGLKDFFGNRLRRGSFISFMGPDKVGKSFWLQDLAFLGCIQRRRVLYCEVGDLTQGEVMERFAQRSTGLPSADSTVDWPLEMARSDNEAKGWDVRMVPKRLEAMTYEKAYQAFRKLRRNKIKSGDSFLKLECAPAGQMKVRDIRTRIQRLMRVGWKPDIVCVDYADILAPPAGVREDREQINTNWIQLSALRQEFDCAVITASQTDAKAYDERYLISRKNFSNDKRKLAHVTGMIGINQTSDEKEKGLCRLNWVVGRRGKYSDKRVCYVAGCLDVARPHVLSIW